MMREMMTLDLSSLQKAVAALERTLNSANSTEKMNALDSDQRDAIKAGAIQNFEFTYELCWKFMQRWLAHNLGRIYVDGISRRALFRLSAEHHLITSVDHWMEFHETRNQTVHTYDAEVAKVVFQAATEFLSEAKALLHAITQRND